MVDTEREIVGIIRDPRGRPTGFAYEDVRLDEQFRLFLPYSNLNDKRIYTGDSLYQAFEAFPVWRLHEVRHLALLTWVGSNPDRVYPLEFPHSRGLHSLVVPVLVEEILKGNHRSEREVTVGIIAGLLHDIATPAGGDPVKLVDPENLEEEKFWWEVIEKKGWDYLRSLGIEKEELDTIIKNDGVLGEVLDIADRIHYVVTDLFHIVGYPGLKSGYPLYSVSSTEVLDKDYAQLEREVRKDPLLGELYKSVAISPSGEVYFEDPERLALFLKIRALLFKHLYANPYSQGKDIRLANLVSQFYSRDEGDKDKLTPGKLRRMQDWELFNWLVKATGTQAKNPSGSLMFKDFLQVGIYDRFDKFDTMEQAMARADEINHSRLGMKVVGIREFKGFNPGTSYKVDHKGNIVQLRDYMPEKAQEIDALSISTKGVYVFYEVGTFLHQSQPVVG